MKIFLIVLLIILIIAFIPIPIKLRIHLNQSETSVFLYSKKINLNKQNTSHQKTKASVSETKKKSNNTYEFLNLKNICFTLINNKHKPKIKFNMDLKFGFEDAALTGLSYGLFSAIYPLLYHTLQLFFNIPKFQVNLNPDFEKITYKLNLKCIISISIAKAIYIFHLLHKNYKMEKSVELSNSTTI